MKLKNSVTIKQTITPATIQLLEMVQLNTVELGRYLTEQAMENPAIDIDELSAASKGGELATVADVCVKAPETETYMIQEYHLPIYHCWCLMLEDRFFGK